VVDHITTEPILDYEYVIRVTKNQPRCVGGERLTNAAVDNFSVSALSATA